MWRPASGPDTKPLLEAGLPQTTEDVIDRGLVRVQSLQSGLSEGQVRVETLQVGEGGLRFPDPAEPGKSGDDIGEAGRPVPIERPGPSSDFNGLGVAPQLIMRSGQRGQPDEQARIARAEENPLFGQRDRILRTGAIEIHLTEENMGRGKARVEFDCLLKLRNCAIGAVRPHADGTQREAGHRVAGIEGDRALRQFVGFGVIGFDILGPAKIGGV